MTRTAKTEMLRMAYMENTEPLTKLLNAVTTTQDGTWCMTENTVRRSFQADVTGTGAVSATIEIRASNSDLSEGAYIGTITLSGTDADSDAIDVPANYQFFRADLTAISGTGAAVTVLMKE